MIQMILIGVAIVACAPVVLFAILSATAKSPKNLGVSGGMLAPCPLSPNCVSTQATDESHRMDPILLTEPPDIAIGRIKKAVASLPRMKVVTETPDYLQVEATSRLFRFVDDVEFFVDSGTGLIHFRSASRVGHSDLGANRRRMEEIRSRLDGKNLAD